MVAFFSFLLGVLKFHVSAHVNVYIHKYMIYIYIYIIWAFLVAQSVKNLPPMPETWVRSLGWEDPLEEGMATHSSILAWRIPVDKRRLVG